MKRSRLKNKANKSGQPVDGTAYKTQRNLVALLNKEARKSFLKNQKTENASFKTKIFLKLCKLLFTEKGFHYKQEFTVKTKRGETSSETIIANFFNTYFVNITKSLNILAWNPENSRNNTDLEKISETFESYASVRHIKEVTSDTKFSFQYVLPWETHQTIMELLKNKATSGNILTKTLKAIARDICVPLTDCINSAILNGVFPDELKLADVTHLYKKSDPEDKTNYRPISVLPSLSNVYEKRLYKQLNSFFETKLSPHISGFRSRYSTQHALSELLFNWQNCLDKSGVAGTILMDLPKAFDCLHRDLIIVKL